MKVFEDIKTTDGQKVFTQEYIQHLRDEDRKKANPLKIVAQRGAQERMLCHDVDILIGGGNRGGPLPESTPVVTPSGYRKIGELQPGDIISGVDGGSQTVVYKYRHGKLPCYRLVFSDGSEVTASADHSWNVRRTGFASKGRPYRNNGEWEVYSTDIIADLLERSKEGQVGDGQFVIPVCEAVGLSVDSTDWGIDMYWLGYGTRDEALPERALWCSVEERQALLQGLMDSAGTVDGRGRCYFSSVSKELAESVKFLVCSLGGVASVSRRRDGKGEYRVSVRINNLRSLFRLPTKRMACKVRKADKELTRRIVECKYVGMADCCCIKVSNSDSLFMVEDFIVTHNSKTYSLLLEGLRDCQKKNYNAVIFRKEKPDLRTIEETSEKIYSQYGIYNRSENKKEWVFHQGGTLKFNYYNDDFASFKDRFQGHQYSYIAVDEITQMPYNKFKYLLTCNRNAYGLRNHFFGTCNPDPDSWVRKFIAWWIDEETGYPIPEKDGVVRYCFMDGDSPDSIYWGDTPEEVYAQCKDIMDAVWTDEMEALGYDKARTLCKSVTFVKAGLTENIKLLESDPTYLANLAGQDEEQRMRDLSGNWNFKNAGDDMIKMQDLENIFDNAHQLSDRDEDYASADIALTGGDNLVMWHRRGHHIVDLFVCRADSRTVVAMVKEKLREWGVKEENFTYDLNGIGQYFKGFFPDALPFNNMAAPIAQHAKDEKGIKSLYANLKSQCAYTLYMKIRNLEISFDTSLLDRKYSGNGFEKTPLRMILMKERKCMRRSESSDDKGFAIIKKAEMKKWVGHSPDFWESLIYLMIFDIVKRHKKAKGLWMI